jgi:hypothetical protein
VKARRGVESYLLAEGPFPLETDFLACFAWLFDLLLVVLEALFEAEELCAGGFACGAVVWAAKVNGAMAAVKASARIVFFMVVFSGGPFLVSPAHTSMLSRRAEFLDSLRRLI